MDLYIDSLLNMLSYWDFSMFASFNGCLSCFSSVKVSASVLRPHISFSKAESFAQGKTHPEQTKCRASFQSTERVRESFSSLAYPDHVRAEGFIACGGYPFCSGEKTEICPYIGWLVYYFSCCWNLY